MIPGANGSTGSMRVTTPYEIIYIYIKLCMRIIPHADWKACGRGWRHEGYSDTWKEWYLLEINSKAFNSFIHSYYIVTISKTVVLTVCYRFIASSYWIPTLTHQGLADVRDYHWITCCNISQDRHLNSSQACMRLVTRQR